MPGPTTEAVGDDIKELKAEIRGVRELIEAEHKQRLEYARIEHERRMEVIEAEAALVDERYRRLAKAITPSNDRLLKLVGTFTAPPGMFGADEEMPY